MQKILNKFIRHPREDGDPVDSFQFKNTKDDFSLDSRLRGNDNSKAKSFIGFIFILFGLLYFFYTILSHSSLLFAKYKPQEADKKYGQSQWAQSQNVAPDKARDEWAIRNHYTGWSDFKTEIKDPILIKKKSDEILANIGSKVVSDSFLYSYVGYKYATGTNPSLLNPEHPPLAKNLIGFSIRTFGNEHILGIAFGFVTLLLVGIISYQLYGSFLLASFALLLTSLFPLFTDQISHGPQLELYQLFFFLLIIHMLLMWKKSRAIFPIILSGIFFGLLLSTKTLLPHLFLFSAWFIIAFRKEWRIVMTVFCIGSLTFLSTYFQYFMLGGTLRGFLGVQKYIVTFYGNASIPFLEFAGNYLRLIFTGSWKFWDTARTVSHYGEWNLLWPLIYIIGMYKLRIRWLENKKTHFLIWFIILYTLFVFIVPIFPRYLLLLYIPLIIAL